jgi:D-aminopeptidase
LTRPRARDLGIKIGILETGKYNAITDVAGIRVGHTTLIEGSGKLVPGKGPIRTGVTAIIPHDGDTFLDKVTGTIYVINGFGEITNSDLVREMGFIEGPIMITNTWNVPRVADAVLDWNIEQTQGVGITTWGISPVVAETSDMYLNDIRGRHVTREHVFHAINIAKSGEVEEGAVGGGTGMTCYDFKGGIGTSSRKLPEKLGGFTVGALVQSNFGYRPQLMIDGVPIGRELVDYMPMRKNETPPEFVQDSDSGSIIIVIATDAPCSVRQLNRLAMRAQNGLARTGSHIGNTSGDFVIAFSTTRRKKHFNDGLTYTVEQIVEEGDLINHMFWAALEATEEAILNSLFKSDTMIGIDDRVAPGLPIAETVELMNKYGHKEVHLP